jgi:mono/diheme cytochrome c family protein
MRTEHLDRNKMAHNKTRPDRMSRTISRAIGLTVLSLAIFTLAALIGCGGKKGALAGKDSTATTTDSTVAATAEPAPEPSTPVKLASYEENQGANLFAKYCSVCHGLEGKGDGFNAFNLDPHPRDLTDSTYMGALSDEQIVQTIANGGRSMNKSHLMPAYGKTLNRDQIRNLATFVRSLPALKQ